MLTLLFSGLTFFFLFSFQFLRQGKIPENSNFSPISRFPETITIWLCRQYRKGQISWRLFFGYNIRIQVQCTLPWLEHGNQQNHSRSTFSDWWAGSKKVQLSLYYFLTLHIIFWKTKSCKCLNSAYCPIGSMHLSPAGLQHRLSAELNYLNVIEESVRQLSDVERVRGISLAQQESVSLAQILKVTGKVLFLALISPICTLWRKINQSTVVKLTSRNILTNLQPRWWSLFKQYIFGLVICDFFPVCILYLGWSLFLLTRLATT